VQIIEVSVIGVRSAVVTLERRDTALRFVLFPMVHVAAPAFYRAVTARLSDCQLVVAEGVRGRSVVGSALTLTYRVFKYNRRRLVVQHLDYEALGIPVITPDMTAADFITGWRQIPARQRLLVWCLIPPITIAMLLLGSRRLLSRFLAVQWSADEEPNDEDALHKLIVDDRDALLLRSLIAIHHERGAEPLDVAVVYGAGHMPAVVRALSAHLGYQPRSAEWLTVWDF
jgi:hypothetical protein